jgi:hypothetical protein
MVNLCFPVALPLPIFVRPLLFVQLLKAVQVSCRKENKQIKVASLRLSSPAVLCPHNCTTVQGHEDVKNVTFSLIPSQELNPGLWQQHPWQSVSWHNAHFSGYTSDVQSGIRVLTSRTIPLGLKAGLTGTNFRMQCFSSMRTNDHGFHLNCLCPMWGTGTGSGRTFGYSAYSFAQQGHELNAENLKKGLGRLRVRGLNKEVPKTDEIVCHQRNAIQGGDRIEGRGGAKAFPMCPGVKTQTSLRLKQRMKHDNES